MKRCLLLFGHVASQDQVVDQVENISFSDVECRSDFTERHVGITCDTGEHLGVLCQKGPFGHNDHDS
jgi:hypothetical protein